MTTFLLAILAFTYTSLDKLLSVTADCPAESKFSNSVYTFNAGQLVTLVCYVRDIRQSADEDQFSVPDGSMIRAGRQVCTARSGAAACSGQHYKKFQNVLHESPYSCSYHCFCGAFLERVFRLQFVASAATAGIYICHSGSARVPKSLRIEVIRSPEAAGSTTAMQLLSTTERSVSEAATTTVSREGIYSPTSAPKGPHLDEPPSTSSQLNVANITIAAEAMSDKITIATEAMALKITNTIANNDAVKDDNVDAYLDGDDGGNFRHDTKKAEKESGEPSVLIIFFSIIAAIVWFIATVMVVVLIANWIKKKKQKLRNKNKNGEKEVNMAATTAVGPNQQKFIPTAVNVVDVPTVIVENVDGATTIAGVTTNNITSQNMQRQGCNNLPVSNVHSGGNEEQPPQAAAAHPAYLRVIRKRLLQRNESTIARKSGKAGQSESKLKFRNVPRNAVRRFSKLTRRSEAAATSRKFEQKLKDPLKGLKSETNFEMMKDQSQRRDSLELSRARSINKLR